MAGDFLAALMIVVIRVTVTEWFGTLCFYWLIGSIEDTAGTNTAL